MPRPLDLLLGRLAVRRGLISASQAEAAARIQQSESPAPPLGVVLVEARFLTHVQVQELLRAQAEELAKVDPHSTAREHAWRLGALAIRLGKASGEQVNAALREQARREESGEPWRALGEILVEQRTMGTIDVDALLWEQSQPLGPSAATVRVAGVTVRADTAPSPLRPPNATLQAQDRTPAPPPADAAPFPLRHFGKYELVGELGRGGMGVVYKAYHPALKSYFAVKVLLSGGHASSEEVQRFHREAQAAARLKHPGILAVHDIGEEEGKTFFAMEYVEGASLDLVLADPVKHGIAPGKGGTAGTAAGINVATALQWTRDIAAALQAAHAAGVVHRDLKPANVIRDTAGRLKVMDFGLAKLVDATQATGATRTGTLMGTPAYMSPEQADGRVKEVDACSDVYQIGAILYELLTGRRPYDGATPMDVVLKVLHEDPRPPRQWIPGLDRDAETICLKAMAREQGRRYATARELAEDCTRALADEPIRARPEAWWERSVRWAKRRKLVMGVGAVAVLGLTIAGATAWRSHRMQAAMVAEAREKDALKEKRLADLRDKAGLYLKSALRLRRAGLSLKEVEEEDLPKLVAAVAEAEREIPESPEPRYHLGRMVRALMKFKEAKDQQDQALAKDADYAPSLYERAVYWAAEYRDRLATLRAEWWQREGQRLAQAGALAQGGLGGEVAKSVPPDDELAEADESARTLRADLRTDLERFERITSTKEGQMLTSGMIACARGMLTMSRARTQPDRDAARGLFTTALEGDPGLEEAVEGLANLLQASGRYADAVSVYDRALAADRGHVPFWTGRGDLRSNWGLLEMNRGEDPGPVYADAIADFGKALELKPASADAWMRRGGVRMNWGVFKMNRGEDPGPVYADAIADYGKALELNPASAEARMSRGMVRSNWGHFKQNRGEDPRPVYADAIADFGKALELDLASAEAWMRRGGVRTNWGLFKESRGEDPAPLYADALADFGKALELNPASADAWMRRGLVRMNWGVFKQNRGEDPGPVYAEALADFGKALELNPASAEACWRRAWLYFNMARWAAAVADFEAAIKIDPSCESNFHAQLAEARRNLPAGTIHAPAPAWLAALAAGGRAVQSGDYAAAGQAYTDALAAAQTALDALPALDRTRLLAEPAVRQALLNAHYNLACVLSLQSAGKARPAAPPSPVAPADAATLRDQAFEHLRAALDLGWSDRDHLAADADLASLHGDPRWAELLGRAKPDGSK